MLGVITGRDVLRNAALIQREFGLGCLVRCFWACSFGAPTTFLSVAFNRRTR